MENIVNAVPETTEKKNKYTVTHGIFALLALVVGCMYRNWVFWNVNVPFGDVFGKSVGFFMFTVVFALYILAFSFASKKKVSAESWFFCGVMLIMSARFVLYKTDNSLDVLVLFALHAAALVFVASMGGTVSDNIVWKLFRSCIIAPFASFFNMPIAIVNGLFRRKNKNAESKTENIVFVIVGICIALPVAIVVFALLCADSFFEQFMGEVAEFISKIDLIDYVNFLTVFVALFIFGALWSAHKEKKDRQKAEIRVLPTIITNTVMYTVLGVYVMFILSQIEGYGAMIMGKIPEGVTYADFARSGFFALCFAACINGGILYFSGVFSEKRTKHNKVLSILMVSVTLVLLTTAAVKMGMYISAYGFTEKRFCTVWLMLLLSVLFIMSLVKLCKPDMKISVYSTYVTASMVALLSVVEWVSVSKWLNNLIGFVE